MINVAFAKIFIILIFEDMHVYMYILIYVLFLCILYLSKKSVATFVSVNSCDDDIYTYYIFHISFHTWTLFFFFVYIFWYSLLYVSYI